MGIHGQLAWPINALCNAAIYFGLLAGVAQNQVEVGTYPTCHGAVAAAKQKWSDSRINGCYYCSNQLAEPVCGST